MSRTVEAKASGGRAWLIVLIFLIGLGHIVFTTVKLLIKLAGILL